MPRYALWALVAPSLAAAAAFPWAIPEPTFVVPAIDGSSPAPTQRPDVAGLELFKRASENEICGYVSGVSASSVTCNNKGDSCATNTYYGAHGCCPSGSLSACSIPTTCIPSSSMSASCTDDECSKNGYIARCTGTAAPECYQYLFIYTTGGRSRTMTEFGCAASPTTAIVERTYSGQIDPNATTSPSVSTKTTTETATSTPSSGPTPLPATQGSSKSNNTPAIIGGTIGGLAVIGVIITCIVFLILRDRRQKREAAATAASNAPPAQASWVGTQSPVAGVTEYNPNGFSPTSPWAAETVKTWKPASSDCGPDGGYMDTRTGRNEATLFGVVESAGHQLHEAPG